MSVPGSTRLDGPPLGMIWCGNPAGAGADGFGMTLEGVRGVGDGLTGVDEAGGGVCLQEECLVGEHGIDPLDWDVCGAVVAEADLLGEVTCLCGQRRWAVGSEQLNVTVAMRGEAG